MDKDPHMMATVVTWAYAIIWLVVLIVVFLPLLIAGYFTRAVGTIVCNCAFCVQRFMERIGEKIP